jgi:valyl-tRNA synthetase
MSEIPKTYEPQAIEEKWYAFWQEHRCFTADPASAKPPYSIVIPPPNVTGVLTLGHVLNNTIQDILARRARMLGKEVLWLPGTDHAGIATQTVVERTLKKQGVIKHRNDLGRDAFIEKVWEWKEKHGGIIIQQLKKLGCSCDWSRERFTMDEQYNRCVAWVFVDLYQKGLIYRGKRMVNWDPVALTALSDEEVTMKPQNGKMYHFQVEVVETGEYLTIATTRPETIPGDTAVAVNPKDPRYAHLIGKHVLRPLPHQTTPDEKRIPIIGDEAVDFNFGTGVLKVTPAHDKADFEIGQRHGLPQVEVMEADGTMSPLAGRSLVGLDRFEARLVAVERLHEIGAMVKEEPYQNNVGYSERTDVPVEPRLSEQWFLKYPSVAQAREVVATGAMKFYPDRWARVYDHWMGNIQDWCISRQLWWGHRVPVWYRDPAPEGGSQEIHPQGLPRSTDEIAHEELGPEVGGQLEPLAGNRGTPISLKTPANEREVYCGVMPPEGEGWEQDTDVLDTWFSSWLWPFATMGWPEKTPELAKFYPTTDLVTGPDIIFFWVARMIMAGFEWMGEQPFRNVYFTGIIRDKQGRKMSKSLGNSPDPLDLIAKYGADALRFGVMRSAPQGQDILYDEKNVELGRNFCTKLWNAARFRQMQAGETEGEISRALLNGDDKWLLLRLDAAIVRVSGALDAYQFAEAAQALYAFFWTEFCDWYLEAAKASLNGPDPARKANTLAVIDFALAHILRLFHPFLPFVTEELWHSLGYDADLPENQGGRTLMYASWPKPLGDDFREHYGLDPSDEALAAAKYEVVNLGRSLRRDFNIASSKRTRFIFKPAAPLAGHEVQVLKLLLNAEPLEIAPADFVPARGTPTVLTPLGELYLPLEGLIDVAAERARLSKEVSKVEQELAKVAAKLGNETFVDGAPPNVVAEHRQRQADWQERLAQLQKLLAALE